MRALTTKEVLEIVGISRTAHYEKLNPNSSSFDPDYPKKIKVGFRSVRYLEQEVFSWLEKKMGER